MNVRSLRSKTLQDMAPLFPGYTRGRVRIRGMLTALLSTMALTLGCIPAGTIRFSPNPKAVMEGYRRDTERLVASRIPRHFVLHRAGSFQEEKDLGKIASRIHTVIQERAGDSETRTKIRHHISFVSFNLNALECMHTLLEKDGHRFFFIAATNRWLAGTAANLYSREINYVDRPLIDRLTASPWLSGIWFDPHGMRSLVETFNTLNRRRSVHPLEIHISTYKLPKKKYLQRLKKEICIHEDETVETLQHVGGLIYEIQRFP